MCVSFTTMLEAVYFVSYIYAVLMYLALTHSRKLRSCSQAMKGELHCFSSLFSTFFLLNSPVGIKFGPLLNKEIVFWRLSFLQPILHFFIRVVKLPCKVVGIGSKTIKLILRWWHVGPK